ncbi:MAG: hypothetical protein KIT22_07680, partial [Verrucomicrobiae bacterium]|nr:hypothetical protein [Verrucomicrobiae bacterium]
MDFAEQLRVLQAAQGDPAKLALATVDLAYPALPDVERARIKEALEAAAVPHWCDEALLAALLEIPVEDAAARLARLRGLSVVETFEARGQGAINVHEAARLVLRQRLASEQPARFHALSTLAFRYFGGRTEPHARIEAIFHQAVAWPAEGAEAMESLSFGWIGEGRFGEALALAVALDELRRLPGLMLLPRAVAIECLGWIRRNHQPADQSIACAQEALVIYRQLRHERRIARADHLLGAALFTSGRPEEARR